MDFSLVVTGGETGFAAVVRGSYDLYNPTGDPQGYLDGKPTRALPHTINIDATNNESLCQVFLRRI